MDQVDLTPVQRLKRAVHQGDLEQIRQCADEGIDLNQAYGPERRTLLHEAAGAGRVDVVSLLLDKHVDVNATKQRVTTVGTDVDDAVQSIQYTYDSLGRQEEVTSYSDAACTTAVNEVVYEYNDFGALSREYQEHEGAKDASTLYVAYNYDDSDTSGEYTKAMRAKSYQYPSSGGKVVSSGSVNATLTHLAYGASSSLAVVRAPGFAVRCWISHAARAAPCVSANCCQSTFRVSSSAGSSAVRHPFGSRSRKRSVLRTSNDDISGLWRSKKGSSGMIRSRSRHSL